MASAMESINTQLDFTIGGCMASVIVNNGFINYLISGYTREEKE